MSNKTLLDRGHFAALCYESIERLGFDAEKFITELGWCAAEFRQRDYCYKRHQLASFWSALERYTGNADIGYCVGQKLPSSRGTILSLMFLNSPTFGASLKSISQFSRLISDAIEFTLGKDCNGTYFQIKSSDSSIDSLRHYYECFFLGFLAFFREVSNNEFLPTRIEFACAAPDEIGTRRMVYGCDVYFGRAENRIYFDESLLSLPCATIDLDLLRMHEDYAKGQLKKIEAQDLLQKVQEVISESLHLGEVTLELVSRKLGLSATEFRYRLANLGTHFIRERESCRRSLVNKMLRRSSESITDIALIAGFSEPSTFYRAFKRWTKGETPADFRARHQKQMSD